MIHRIRSLIVLLALVAGGLLVAVPPSFLTPEAARAGGFTLLVLSLWATGLIPEFLTALIFFTGAMLLALAPPAVVFSGFTSTAFWLILGGMVLGAALHATGLGRRLAALMATRLGRSYAWLVFGLVLAGMLFSLFMPSAFGRVVLLVPIGVGIAEQFGLQRGSRGYTGIAMAVVLGPLLPGFAILPSNVANMVLAGLAESLYGYSPLYGEYLFLHFPVLGLLKGLLLWALILFLFPASLAGGAGAPRAERTPMQRDEKILTVVLLALLALWVTDFLHHISPAWVAMAGACIVMLPAVGIVKPQLFQQQINFGSLFYIGGILGLGQMINHTGLGSSLAEKCIQLLPLDPAHPFLNFSWLGALALFTGVFTTQPGIPAVLTPFAGELSAATGLPLEAVLMTQVLGFSQPLFPYQVPPLLIGLQMAGVRPAEGFRVCLLLVAASFLFLFPAAYLWWRMTGWL